MTEVNLDTLKANRIISKATKKVKIFGICEISQAMTVTGINVTKGAKKSIEKAGGTIAAVEVKPIREKFLKTTKKANQTNSQTTEESAE
jgi:large subunit ribosomal protein L15